MKMKKILVVLMILLFSVSFVGCSSAKELSAINTKFSSMYFVVDFSESYSSFSEAEFTALKTKTEDLAGTYVDDIELRYIASLNAFEKAGLISSNEKILYKNHLSFYFKWNEGTFSIEFRLNSAEASRIFIRGAEYSGAINEEEFLKTTTYETFSKIFSKTKNNLITSSLEGYFETGVKNYLTTAFGVETVNKLSTIDFYYMFVTENVKLRSKNADETLSLDGGSVFCFYSNSEYEEPEFTFYVVQANSMIYYLICLALAFTFVAIYLIVIYFKKPKQNGIELNVEEKNDEIEK